jgi:nucleoside-diphosphate-sugar epimerase
MLRRQQPVFAIYERTQPTIDPGPTTHSTRKVALERELLDRARVAVTVLRPCAIHGIGPQHPREWWLVKRILDSRKLIPLAYRGSSRFHTGAVANIAALVCTVLEVPGTRVLNIADPTAPSVAEIAALIARHLAYEGAFVNGTDGDYPQPSARHPGPYRARSSSILRPRWTLDMFLPPLTRMQLRQFVAGSSKWHTKATGASDFLCSRHY